MRGITPDEQKLLLRSVGTHRGERALSPVEVGRLLKKAVTAGATRKECADGARLGQTQVSTFLKLTELAPEIQHLADWGGSNSASVSFSSLAELARLPRNDQKEAAAAILRHKLTWKEVIQLVQMADRSGKLISQCIEDVLKLRPQVETRHLFVGSITSEVLRERLKTMTQIERDKLFDRALRDTLGLSISVSGRLGIDTLTILSPEDLSKVLQLKPDEIETSVNDALEQASKMA